MLRRLGVALAAALSISTPAVGVGSGAIELARDCPPGFELTGCHCELRSLYQMYPSLKGAGIGGLKSGLPGSQDGFTPQQIDLGRYLFSDPVLSVDGSLPGASCHQPDKGLADDLARSAGLGGRVLRRSAPSLWNVAFLWRLFWDGRAGSLEEQMLGPLYDPREMANTRENLLTTLNAIPQYRRLFAVTWPAEFANDGARIQLQQAYAAITGFQTSLISLNSRYDQYAHGYMNALSEAEKEGMNIFRSFVARCAECHAPPLFTNQQTAVIGTPEPQGRDFDPGAEIPMGEPSQRGGFKVPGLRNIALTRLACTREDSPACGRRLGFIRAVVDMQYRLAKT